MMKFFIGLLFVFMLFVACEEEITPPVYPPIHNTTISEYYETIQLAIDSADDGHTILVSPGTYNENIYFNDDSITLLSTDGAETTIIWGDTTSVMKFASLVNSSIIIDGFTITNGNSEKGGGVFCENSTVTMKNMIINENNCTEKGGGIYIYNNAHLIIENSIIANNSSSNSGFGGGIYSGFSSTMDLSYCQITENVALSGGGIYLDDTETNIINTTIANNQGGGILESGVYSELSLLNSVIGFNEINNMEHIAGVINVSFSNVEGYWLGEGNIDSDPLFNADYNLQPESPCIDMGNPAEEYKDPDGTRNDVGCYYFDQQETPLTLTARFFTEQTNGYQVVDEFQFIDISLQDENNPIVGWEWNFGDGNTSTEQTPTHIYEDFGVFTVSLTVDNGVTIDTLVKENYIVVDEIDFPLVLNNTTSHYYESIQLAIDDAIDGHEILVFPGTYNENIYFNGKDIVLQSTDGPLVTIIDGTNDTLDYVSVVKFVDGEFPTSVLDGFTIMNGYNQRGGGIYCENYSSPTLRNLIVKENTAYYDSGGGIYCSSHSSPIIENVLVMNNSAYEGGGGIYCEHYSSPQITNVIICNNNSVQRDDRSVNGGGILCKNYSCPTLENVTIYANHSQYGSAVYCNYHSDINIKNSIIWENETFGGDSDIYEAMSDISVIYSDVQNGYNGEGNIDLDPLFIDAENGDFSLDINSPCIGTGENGADMGANLSW